MNAGLMEPAPSARSTAHAGQFTRCYWSALGSRLDSVRLGTEFSTTELPGRKPDSVPGSMPRRRKTARNWKSKFNLKKLNN